MRELIEGSDLGRIDNFVRGGGPEGRGAWSAGWRLEDTGYRNCQLYMIKLIEPVEQILGGERRYPDHLADRPTIRNVSFDRCVVGNYIHLSAAVLNGVSFTNTKTRLDLELCAFREVVLRGRFGELKINWHSGADRLFGKPGHVANREAVDRQNDEFHQESRWLLDISEADFTDWGIRDLPPDKVRIDPTRQAFFDAELTRGARALIEPALGEGLVSFVLRQQLGGDRERLEFVHANPRKKHGEEDIALIALLYENGLTVPTASHIKVDEPPAPPDAVGLPHSGLFAEYFPASSLDVARAMVLDGSYLDHSWPASAGSPDPIDGLERITAALLGSISIEPIVAQADADEAVVLQLHPDLTKALAAMDQAQVRSVAAACDEAMIGMDGPATEVLSDLAGFTRSIGAEHLFAVLLP